MIDSNEQNRKKLEDFKNLNGKMPSESLMKSIGNVRSKP